MDSITKDDAYHEGYRAYFDGCDDTNCPYPTGSEDALGEYWLDGLDDAREDHGDDDD